MEPLRFDDFGFSASFEQMKAELKTQPVLDLLTGTLGGLKN